MREISEAWILQDYERVGYLVNKLPGSKRNLHLLQSSLWAIIFPSCTHPRYMQETAPFMELVNQHVQVVREQGWDAMYDY